MYNNAIIAFLTNPMMNEVSRSRLITAGHLLFLFSEDYRFNLFESGNISENPVKSYLFTIVRNHNV